MTSWIVLAPLAAFLVLLVVLSFLTKKRDSRPFLEEYFLGSRELKGFVLAMTLTATYGSVSSFVSGPGIAWDKGLGWVVFAAPQMLAGFLILGVLGKKIALVSRRQNNLTLIDLLQCRYESKWMRIIPAVGLLVFFSAMMTGQFIGGATILSAATGASYELGLLIFGAVVVFYTAWGGYRAVVLTDTLCAVLMLAGMFALAYGIASETGGFPEAMQAAAAASDAAHPDRIGSFLSPTAGGTLPIALLASAWILVGFGTVGLPQSAVRAMSYQSSSDLHQAMWITTIVTGVLMLGMTLLGVLMRGVDDPALAALKSTDAVLPYFVANHMNPWVAGITLIGPIAATMSTVSSLLIGASSAIVEDLMLMNKKSAGAEGQKRAAFISKAATYAIGLVSLLAAVYPMDLVAWINIAAFGGLELTFLIPLVAAFFYRKANACGVLASIAAGVGSYLVIMFFKIPFGGFHAVVPSMALALAALFIFSNFGRRPSQEVIEKYFG